MAMSPDEFAEAMLFVMTEFAGALSNTEAEKEALLEQFASNLLTISGQMPACKAQEAVAALAKCLVQTEEGSQLGQ